MGYMPQTRTPDPSPTAPRVARAERALAPDLTRGAMLLFIALANAGNCAFAGEPGLDPRPHGPGRVLNFLLTMLVNNRAYPVFGLMFGYGLVQLARSRSASTGYPTTSAGGFTAVAGGGLASARRRILLQRNTALVVFGFAHGTLLYFGDFLGAYGIVGILATLVILPRGDRFHRIVLWLWLLQTVDALIFSLRMLWLWAGDDSTTVSTITNRTDPSLAAHSYGRSLLDRLQEWPVHTATVLPFIIIVWLGIWAARRRLLEEPAAHRTLLRRVAFSGLAISLLGGLPYALVSAGALHVNTATVDAMSWVHAITGEYGGVAYAALFGLLVARLTATPNHRPSQPGNAAAAAGTIRGTSTSTSTSGVGDSVIGAVAALGRRSLSGYLFQSCVWLMLFSRWALDLGGSTYVALSCAFVTWTVSVLAARRMDARGRRGPAETLLRRAYHRPPATLDAPAVPSVAR